MLEAINETRFEDSVYRFVNQSEHVKVLTDMGLDAIGITEMVTLLRERGLTDDPIEILDGPFAPKPLLKPIQTRFSDGRMRVFYSALEPETAEAEVLHWYMKPLLGGASPLRAYYRRATCTFNGYVKDLRPWVDQWPFLTADDGYDACNTLGTEAATSGLDGLLSRSARRVQGTTLPIFSRSSLEHAHIEEYHAFDYDPKTGDVTVSLVS